MPEHKSLNKEHKLVLTNQEQMHLTGISRVESFNYEEILLETELGLLSIRGEDLDMHNLNLEQSLVEITGVITEITYSGTKAVKRGILERIFK